MLRGRTHAVLLSAAIFASLLCGPSSLAQNGGQPLEWSTENRVDDPIDGNNHDDLGALLQELKNTWTEWPSQQRQHHNHYQEHERLLSKEGRGERLQDRFPQRNMQRDRDRSVSFQWGRFRPPRIRIRRIRIPRIRRIRIPRIRRIRIPRIPKIRLPRFRPKLPRLPRVRLPRIRVPRIRLNPRTFINKLRGIQRTMVGKLNPLRHLRLPGLGNIANGIARNAISSVGRIGNQLQNNIMRGVGSQVRGIAGRLSHGVSSVTRGIIRNLSNISSRLANGFKQKILRYAKAFNDKALRRVHQQVQGIFKRVQDIGRRVVLKARQMNGGIISGIRGISNRIWKGLGNIQSQVHRHMKTAKGMVISSMKAFGTTIWKKVKAFVGNMWKSIKRTSSKAFKVFKKTYRAAKGAGTKVFNVAKRFGKMIWRKLKSFVKKVWSGMKKAGAGVLKKILSSGKSLIKFAKSPLGQQILQSGLQGALNALGVPPGLSGPVLNSAMSMLNRKQQEAGQQLGNGEGKTVAGREGKVGGKKAGIRKGGTSVQMTPESYSFMQGRNSHPLFSRLQTMASYDRVKPKQGQASPSQQQVTVRHSFPSEDISPYDVGYLQERSS